MGKKGARRKKGHVTTKQLTKHNIWQCLSDSALQTSWNFKRRAFLQLELTAEQCAKMISWETHTAEITVEPFQKRC